VQLNDHDAIVPKTEDKRRGLNAMSGMRGKEPAGLAAGWRVLRPNGTEAEVINGSEALSRFLKRCSQGLSRQGRSFERPYEQ
jgi:hypothetical protein